MSDTALSSTPTIAGLVLAAGYSSRMGAFKPLLRLGQRSVIETVVGLLQRAGIADVIVVIGHRAQEMRPIVEALGAVPVLNPDFDRGMYSSVTTGIRAIPPSCQACMLLPVDIPLVRPATIDLLGRTFISRRPSVLYPVFQGRRGHPPVIARQVFDDILAGDGTGGLRTVLAHHHDRAETVAVYDSRIHRDMDTPEDYAALCALVQRRDIPDLAECEAMLANWQPDSGVVAHVHRVAAVAGALTADLIGAGVTLDPDMVQAASLLHDIAKGQPDHALAGARLLDQLGYPEVARIIAHHSDLDFTLPDPDEQAAVFLADKLVQGDRIVPFETRFQRTFDRLAGNPEGLEAARKRYHTTRQIAQAVERRTGRTLPQILDSGSDPAPLTENGRDQGY
jgi:CTP:molybdopterin cytidylyltransferase MocA